MKKKQSIREARNQAQADTRMRYQAQNAQQQKAEEEKRRQEEARKKPANVPMAEKSTLNPVRERKLSDEKKSSAKAAGLKSTFVLGDGQLLMTAFGKGNDAIVEKKVSNGAIKTIPEAPSFHVTPEADVAFLIDGRIAGGTTDNPLHVSETAQRTVKRGQDLIGAKALLEKRYYGREFEDNIHIQVIYNILDIEKILAVHINNIVYTLNNFLRNDGEDLIDLIGYITLYDDLDDLLTSTRKNTKEIRDLFFKLCKARQLGYINLEVIPSAPVKSEDGKKNKPDPNTIKLTESEFFDALYILGIMRQMLAHGDPHQHIYKMEGYKGHPNIDTLLNRLYAEAVNDLNRGFLQKSAKNLVILFKAFGVTEPEEKAEYVRLYYDFVVRKEQKNQGFSIKILREHMTADIKEAYDLRDKKYDTVRGKLYPFVDFVIYRYYMQREKEVADLVGRLRASASEVEKDQIYAQEAVRVWPQLRNVILKHILPEMSGDVIKALTTDPQVDESMIRDVQIGTDATFFSKFIYLVTLFINGKEINDLLTTLIHKFESIASFLSVMDEEGMRTPFVEDFGLFSQSGQVARELRIINSFARMSKPSANARQIMFIEAFRVLGIKADEAWLEREVQEMLDPNTKKINPQKSGLRNFIANNVIESDRFQYVVRYCNVRKVKGLVSNRNVVLFVLRDIPDAQIQRYYASITGNDVSYDSAMRGLLADRLTGFTFEDISDVQQNDQKANQRQQEEKRQKQALVRLYLTVLYLAAKNLVYVNSRYFLAFHCVERDRLLLHPEKWRKESKHRFDPEYEFAAFARDRLAEMPQKKRVQTYLAQNFANADDWAIRAFRNKVEHLDAVRNADLYLADIHGFDSWFELYHYVIQRRLMDQYAYDSTKESKEPGTTVISADRLNPKTLAYFSMVEKFHGMNKDFLKALCVPFAYNLPRYKNLTIDALFDMNRPGEKGTGKDSVMAPEDAS